MKRWIVGANLLAVAIGLVGAGCGGSAETDKPFVKLQGAGASFPAPLYNKWFKEYNSMHPNVQIDYQSVGSGSGVKNFINQTVDFAASDAAMKESEIAQVERGVVLLPMTAGSIVLAYNLEGVDELKLSREAYTGIFLGKVTKWNDPLIADNNRGLDLPDSAINVIVRADSSGTTYVFTKHLSEISEEFAESPGTNKMPNWSVGTKSKGNEGITASIMTTPGSIGYIEFGYAEGQGLSMATLENKAGSFIQPSIESAQAALAAVDMPENLIAWLPDPEGENSYPIVTFTWLLAYGTYEDEAKYQALVDVINYALTEGQEFSTQLGYIPLPEEVVTKVQTAVEQIELAGAGGSGY